MEKKLLDTAAGKRSADLVVTNGKIVTFTPEKFMRAALRFRESKIAAVGDVAYAIGEGTKVIDAKGRYITPGFIDGHVHPESSSLAIRSFAELVLKHGTTVVMADMHEIGVVGGIEAIEAVLDENEITDLKIYFVVPLCAFCTVS